MALINKDKNGLEEYNRRRMYLANQKEELNTIKSELNDINNDISEIKELLQLLLNKG
jgi:archaellum component FlaC